MLLQARPLTREAFADYGDVIALEHARQWPINQGLTTRYHDLVNIDADAEGGRPLVSLFRTAALPLPHAVAFLERHPLGSQAFLPMDQRPFAVLVAPAGDTIRADDLELFITNGRQGINLHRNTWHHYQVVLDGPQDFIVVDRGGPGDNLEERAIEGEAVLDDRSFRGGATG